MASAMDPEIKIDVNGYVIDCNWFYGCLLSPKKFVDIHASLSLAKAAEDDGDNEKGQHGIGREETTDGSNDIAACFGSRGFDSAKDSKEDGDHEIECLASTFRVLDEDGDGRVTVHEIMRFLQRFRLEMPMEEVESVVRSVSAGGDEFLTAMDFSKFCKIILKDGESDVEEKAICKAFSVFDENGDGLISALELGDVLSRLGFEEGKDADCCQCMIERVDCNGDGFVDIDEFRHLMTRSSPLLSPH